MLLFAGPMGLAGTQSVTRWYPRRTMRRGKGHLKKIHYRSFHRPKNYLFFFNTFSIAVSNQSRTLKWSSPPQKGDEECKICTLSLSIR